MSTDTIITLASMLSMGIAGLVLLSNIMNRGFDNVNKRLDDVNKRFDDINTRFDDMNKRLDDHGSRLTRIEDGYVEIAQRISRLEGRISLYPPIATPEAEPLNRRRLSSHSLRQFRAAEHSNRCIQPRSNSFARPNRVLTDGAMSSHSGSWRLPRRCSMTLKQVMTPKR